MINLIYQAQSMFTLLNLQLKKNINHFELIQSMSKVLHGIWFLHLAGIITNLLLNVFLKNMPHNIFSLADCYHGEYM